LEFEVLDELYFVIPFEELLQKMDLDSSGLSDVLYSLCRKGWIRIYKTPDDELDADQVELSKFQDYFFLASKEGLFAHNTQ
jgi:DNA-binding MarR family transcriptional regulator